MNPTEYSTVHLNGRDAAHVAVIGRAIDNLNKTLADEGSQGGSTGAFAYIVASCVEDREWAWEMLRILHIRSHEIPKAAGTFSQYMRAAQKELAAENGETL